MSEEKRLSEIGQYIQTAVHKNAVCTACKMGKSVQAVYHPHRASITTALKDGTIEARESIAGPAWLVQNCSDGKECYLVSDEIFKQRYQVQPDGSYLPKQITQLFVQITENVAIPRPDWGCDQHLLAGAWLNVTNPEDVYGVAEHEFEQAYKVIDTSDNLRKQILDLYRR